MSHEIYQLEFQKHLEAYVLLLFFVLRMTGWMPQTFFFSECNFHINFMQYNMILLS